MRIGIDCRLSGHAHAGIGRYIEQLILRLPALAKETTWVYFFHDQRQIEASPPLRLMLSQTKNVAIVLAPVSHYSLTEQYTLPPLFLQENLDLLHIPHFNVPVFTALATPRLVITIHDLLWHQYRGPMVTTLPKWQYWLKYAAYRSISYLAVTRARAILVPTQTVKDTVLHYFNQAQNKIAVTYEGSFTENMAIVTENSDKHADLSINQPSLLYVGSLYPHKNIQVVIAALQQLPKYHLYVVSARGVFLDRTKKLVTDNGVDDRVHFLSNVDDATLQHLYKTCDCLVQPSLSEGFGLTPLEALTLGTPVIASDIPIFKELYQDIPLYFDPQSPDSLVVAVKELPNYDVKKMRVKIQELSRRYNWDAMAKTTFAVYQNVLNQTP